MQRLFFTGFRFLLGGLLLMRAVYVRVMTKGPYRDPPRVMGPRDIADLARRDVRFRKLRDSYVHQVTDSACSAASIACVINAMAGPGEKRVTDQMDLVECVHAGHWKSRLSPDGWQGRRGLPLPVLGAVAEAAFSWCRLNADVSVIPFYHREHIQSRRERARNILDTFYENPKVYLIAHFDQGAFLPELNIPHISPVGAWDPDTETVTILDVDVDQEYPYQVSLFRFVEGISSCYGQLLKVYGYDHGGLVVCVIE